MRGDTVAGAVVLLVGAVVLVNASTFPEATGQPIGPGFFPQILGVGLAVCGLVLVLAERIGRPADVVTLAEGLNRPRMLANALAVIAGLAVYALVVTTLGFFITSTLLLLLLLLAFGVGRVPAAVLALIVPVVLHYIFYTILRVPLPWGVLEGMAW